MIPVDSTAVAESDAAEACWPAARTETALWCRIHRILTIGFVVVESKWRGGAGAAPTPRPGRTRAPAGARRRPRPLVIFFIVFGARGPGAEFGRLSHLDRLTVYFSFVALA